MEQQNGTAVEVRELPSGFWAIFIDGNFVDAASASRDVALAKLNMFYSQNGIEERRRTRNERTN